MTKTEHYQLNQWEPTDQVLRTDFNADNAKIDAALAAVNARADTLASQAELNEVRALATKSRFTKLWETTTTADGTVEIDMSVVDWSKWDKVHLEYEYNDSADVHIRVNDIANTEPYIPIYAMNGLRLPRITFYPGFQPMRSGSATYGSKQYNLSARCDGIKKLVLIRGKAGAHISLWGEA